MVVGFGYGKNKNGWFDVFVSFLILFVEVNKINKSWFVLLEKFYKWEKRKGIFFFV